LSACVWAKPIPATDSLRSVLKQDLTDTTRVNTLIALSKSLRNSAALESFSFAQQAYQISININYRKGVGYSSDIMGVLYLNFGDYKKALYHHFQSLKIFEQINDIRGLAYTYNNLGAVHSHLKNYAKAKDCYQQSLNIKLSNGLYKEASSSYINLGNIAMYQKNLNDCIHYYLMGLNNAQKYNDDQNITIALMNLGEGYFDKSNIRIAEQYYRKALTRVSESKNKYFSAQIYFALGKIYDAKKKYDESEQYFKTALQISRSEQIKPLCLNIYKYTSIMYQHQGKYREALLLNQNYMAINDSIYNEESAKTNSQIQTVYELEKKEEQIKLLHQEKEIIKAKESKQVIVRNFFIVAFTLISIIAFISIRSIFRKQKSNRLLQIKNTKIEWQRSELERKNIALQAFNRELKKENVVAKYESLKAKINPHFLFNSLSTLSALIIQNPQKALQFVSKFSKIYRSIMEHSNEQLISVNEELNMLENYIYLCKMRYEDSLNVTTTINQHEGEKLIPAFSLQLLVENAVKHNIISPENPLSIHIFTENGYLCIQNSLQPKLNAEPSSGWGQQSIIERYKLISDQEPVFGVYEQFYIARIPLLKKL
jgi:sensor histidine kinase YesM